MEPAAILCTVERRVHILNVNFNGFVINIHYIDMTLYAAISNMMDTKTK
jgi:hypothetical protein